MMSGHCAWPQTDHPEESHERCTRMGGGNRANPSKDFSPCPCPCHYPADEYECADCGGTLKEAPLWPNEWGDDEPVYTHIDPATGRATGEACPVKAPAKPKREPAPEPEPVYYEPRDKIEAGQSGDDEFDDLLAELDEVL